jgi:signal transduction histidine kinase
VTTIRGRLLAILLGGLVVVLTAGGAAVYWVARAGLLRQFDDGLLARARTLASLVKREPENLVFESGDAPSATIAETYFELRDESGKVLKRSANLGGASLPQRDLDQQEFAIDNADLPHSAHGRAIWLAFRPRFDPDDWQGHDVDERAPETLMVIAAMDRHPIDRGLDVLLAALVAVGGTVGIAVGVLVAFGVRWGLRPLERLSRQIAGVSGATISKRFDEAGAPGELAPIHRELNGMFDRVEQALERERLFVDAAAHEFRTPLAELRATAEVAMKWPDPQRTSSSFKAIHAIGGEMERLVESLLLVSRGHASAHDQAMDDIPMAPIVHECLERTAPLIQEKRLTLTIDLGDHASAFKSGAPEGAVEIIIRNLIDNAVQYTPLNGHIAIRNEGAGNGSSSFIVENDPVALGQHDLPRLFEPFWRLDGSRSDRRHVGLGLTIVHQIAEAVGLRVEAALAGSRLQVRVSVP